MRGESNPAIQVHYKWIAVEVELGIPFTYPSIVSRHVKSAHAHAAVYRCAFYKHGKLSKAYVGEAWNLAERIPGYLKPGPSQKTNIRIKELILRAIEEGFDVRLETVEIEPFRINNVLVSNGSLGNRFVRLLVENFLVEDSDKVTCEILNLNENPMERRLRKSQGLRIAEGLPLASRSEAEHPQDA